MDTRTGDVYAGEELKKMMGAMPEEETHFMKRIRPSHLLPRNQKELTRSGHTKVGRNDPCPCGSGKKFKRCCLQKG